MRVVSSGGYQTLGRTGRPSVGVQPQTKRRQQQQQQHQQQHAEQQAQSNHATSRRSIETALSVQEQHERPFKHLPSEDGIAL